MNSKHGLGRYRNSAAFAMAVALVITTAVALVVGCQRVASTAPAASAGGSSADPVRTDINISGPFLENPDNKDPHDPANYQRCGSPRIVQNAKNPENLVVVCFGVGGFNYQTPQPLTHWYTKDITKNTSRAVAPTFVSNDGGNTWSRVLPNPLDGDYFQSDRDPMAAGGPNGEIYISADAVHFPVERKYGPVIVTPGLSLKEGVGLGFSSSLDGGKTWSKASILPLGLSNGLIAVDQSTGVIYATSICVYVTTIGAYGCSTGDGRPRYLAVSKDQGRTWSPSPDILNKEPATEKLTPGRLLITRGSAITAGHGVFATIGQGAAGGPQLLRYSTDHGATYTERPMQLGNCRAQKIAADPTHRGGFAVLAGCNRTRDYKIWWLGSIPTLRVFVTRDMGLTWKQGPALSDPPPPGIVVDPKTAGASPTELPLDSLQTSMEMSFFISKTEIAYGPTGVLGVAWTQIYGPPQESQYDTVFRRFYPPGRREDPIGPSDVYLALSTDGGTTFGKPVRLNSRASPPSDPRQHDGDERWMGLAIDRRFANVVWPDWRSGEVQTWFRKVPIPGGG